MPTKEEQDELREKCTWTGTTQNGVYGCKVTGPNGKSIFLPVAGCMIGGSLYAYAYGFYWSSSLFTDCPYYADYLKFYSDGMSLGFYSDGMSEDYYFRAYGYSVRPVCQ